MTPAKPWWHPEAHADRQPLLHARSRIMGGVRGWFGGQGFMEADPGCLQVSPGNEAHIHGLNVQIRAPEGQKSTLYLHSSPEFAMKKLLAGGETRLYSLGHVWRDRENSPTHAIEFTMLEWYRAGELYQSVMDDCAALLALACRITGAASLRYKDREADPFAAPEYITVSQAFALHAGIDLMAVLEDVPAFAAASEKAGVPVAADDNWSDIFSRLIVAKVEPKLGLGRMTFLTEYPACEAALARRKPGDPRVSERFELYACGVELANGFGELTDPAEQRRRLEAEMDEKQRIYGERYPLDEDFLAALAHMPDASGVALGFDRLVMLATGAPRLEQVIWTPLAMA
ncbi:MAG: EF-P lysine aminoacylase EpmA [Aestuariivirgaceae bacterium]|nr:EF-P lysine aminoacylase EpmA [Aestuariivirgaceae bacterium]